MLYPTYREITRFSQLGRKSANFDILLILADLEARLLPSPSLPWPADPHRMWRRTRTTWAASCLGLDC